MTLHDSRLLLETFHFLLHAQCSALLAAFRLTPQLVSTLGRLWVGYVRWWQREGWGRDEEGMVVFTVAPGIQVRRMREKVKKDEREWQQTKAETKAAARGAADDERQAEEKDSSNAAQHTATRSLRSLGVAELSLPLSLAFLYVALQSCRCSLTMHQLISLARINRLPYLNFIQLTSLPPRLHTLLATSPSVRAFYRPHVLPSARLLLQLAHHVCAALELAAPAAPVRRRRDASVRACFGPLHDEWFHVSGCVRAYMRQMRVPNALYGLCVAMTRVWSAVRAEKWRNRRDRDGTERATKHKLDALGEDEEAEGQEEEEEQEEQMGGSADMPSGGHDEWSVMVCVVTVLKLVYGLDRVADEDERHEKDERREAAGAEEESNDEEEEEKDNEREEKRVDSEPDSDADDAGQTGESAAEQRQVNVAARFQTEEQEHEEYRQLQQMLREQEEEKQQQQRAEAELHHDCSGLLQMLADDCSPPPSTPLEADLVRLFNPSTHFPSSLYEARHMRPDQQADMLRLWDEAILPPSLGVDDYGEYIDKMNALHPPLDSAHAAAAADKPSLASLWRHLSSTLAHSHHATYRQYSRSRQFASQPLHADYALVLHCGALLCGLSADGLHRRVWWWGQQLWRWMGRRRYHSVGWKKHDKEVRARMDRRRRKRRREHPSKGKAEMQAEQQEEEEEAEEDEGKEGRAEDEDDWESEEQDET